MASNTPNLNLLKKDPATDGNDTFNIQTMLNDNWDKIDAAVGEVREELKDINVPDASLTQKGITLLSSATDSTAEDRAATPKAVKSAYDAATAAQITANAANTAAAGAQNTANAALTTSGTAESNAKNASIPRAMRFTGDLNGVTENGFYDGANMANAPSADWYYVEHMSHSQDPGNWRLQRATNFYDGVTYWRQLRAGTWTAWQTWGGNMPVIVSGNTVQYTQPTEYSFTKQTQNAYLLVGKFIPKGIGQLKIQAEVWGDTAAGLYVSAFPIDAITYTYGLIDWTTPLGTVINFNPPLLTGVFRSSSSGIVNVNVRHPIFLFLGTGTINTNMTIYVKNITVQYDVIN
ncbi:pyocin knob domain-containing protein [Paenibacillus macerans]|uniref:pyocin knob domain-containing protein n=1 Tax=Paenibacillus macerans TaxID=44252 RepID=UPI001F0DFFDC|nr:pyocin knob domain-containing protein [Paenibacillus macerans]UMV47228.1 pyocin knob domain-containing protein [Paenibacillus macerans]